MFEIVKTEKYAILQIATENQRLKKYISNMQKADFAGM